MYAKLDEDGKIIYPPHNAGNLMNSHLNPAWLAEHGFEDYPEEWFAAHAPVAPDVPRRYSTLKLHDAVGHERWMAIVSALPEEQQNRLALAQELSTADTQFAAALETLKQSIPDAERILGEAEL